MVINNSNKIYYFSGFILNSQQRLVTNNSKVIDLSKKGFDLLALFLHRHGELLTKDEVLAAVWPNQFITDSALNKQISRLRQIFDSPDSDTSIIETVRGAGFRLLGDVQESSVAPVTTKTKKSYLSFVLTTLVLATGKREPGKRGQPSRKRGQPSFI